MEIQQENIAYPARTVNPSKQTILGSYINVPGT
jgi:hypothetical protein